MVNADKSVTLIGGDPFSWTNNFNGFSGNDAFTGLSSSIVFNFTGIANGRYQFNFEMKNTSSGPIDFSRLTIFGFNSNPDVIAVSTGAGDLFNVVSSGNQPNGLDRVEVCFKDMGNTNNCTGAQGGLNKGTSTTGSFALQFKAPVPNAITLSGFTVRYQGIDSQTLGLRGASASGQTIDINTPDTVVPEPGTWAMMLGGFGMLGAAARRRRVRSVLA